MQFILYSLTKYSEKDKNQLQIDLYNLKTTHNKC